MSFNGTTPSAGAPPAAELGTITEWREGPAVAEQVFEVRVTAGSKTKERSSNGESKANQ